MKWHRDLFSFWAYAIPSEKGLDVKSNLNHKNTSYDEDMDHWSSSHPWWRYGVSLIKLLGADLVA